MKIFAISIVKNEADIIAKNLQEASQWADKIFVLDNGSTDGTWEIVQALASDKIVPYKQDKSPFHDGIRAQVFQAYQHLAADGDWWCFRLDADEFYIDSPVEFLAKVPSYHHFVVTDSVQFRLTKEDFANGQSPQSIEDIRYHDKKTWSETRFFRHRTGMQWPSTLDRPRHMGVLHSRRIKLRHYQYRSLDQIRNRVAVRAEAKKSGFGGFQYSVDENVESYLHDRKELNYYDGPEKLQIEGPSNHLFQRWYDVVLKTILHATKIYK